MKKHQLQENKNEVPEPHKFSNCFSFRFRGISSGPDREQQVGKQPGMVFQSFNLFSHLTIIENLMLAQTELLKRSREEDGGTVDLDVTYPGEDRDPLEEGEGLSLTLTRHACSMLQWEYEGGICRIKGRLAQT